MLTLSNKLQPQMSKSHRRSSSSGGHARHAGHNNPHPLDNGIDHLFLLPERALSMSASRLQKDLAGLDFDVRLLHEAPMGNVWLSGSRPSSVTKEERENRARTVRERQHEERQRKLEEIKVQAFAAQRFKEQKETERRHRLDELRNKEDSRRAQVEERKRAINEAERDRLESILKRNQEREARLEAKKRNERSSMVFAFGSSTPRMLDDIGPYCGPRRATSTQNIMSASVMSTSIAAGVPSYGTTMVDSTDPAPGSGLTRRQSERELDATGKKRATSAGGLERTGDTGNLMSMSMYEMSPGVGSPTISSGGTAVPAGGAHYTSYRYHGITRSYSAHFGNGQQQVTTPATPAGCVSGYVGRRRTDLVPTIPLKDTSSLLGSPSPSRLNNSANGTKSRSSPGRAYSMSRLDQLATPRKRHVALPVSLVLAFPQPLALSQLHTSRSSGGRVASGGDMSRSMSHLAASTAAGANKANTPARPLRKADSRSMHHLSNGQAPLPPPRMTRATQLRQQMQKVIPPSNAISSVIQNEAPSRPGSAMSHQSTTSIASSTMGFSTTVHMRNRPLTAPVRKPRPISIAITGISSAAGLADKAAVNGNAAAAGTKPPLPKSRRHTAVVNRSHDRIKKINKTNQQQNPIASPTEPLKQQEEPPVLISQPELAVCDLNPSELVADDSMQKDELASEITQIQADDLLIPISESNTLDTTTLETDVAAPKSADIAIAVVEDVDRLGLLEDFNSDAIDMTASMMSKVRINTEEEAKAALAEKRRIAREEAEKQAEQERQRREEEIRAEQERQQREEEQQRVLIEEMKAAEQKRLEEAIKQKQLEEEEEHQRLMEETRQKALKEEAERRAKEEAERQKLELEERMRNEEKEREQRRKRVEAIMLRTRGKNTSNTSPPQSEEKSEKLNGSNPDVAENGHKNDKNMQTVDNIIPVDTLKNANIIETMSTDDALNSNNAWQMNTPTDLLM